ncbi:hypothetical protein [Streptomyces sp. WG7]|uniref:hypothetical protein n=1 Tax=Streptomyces sp. WG7 TaxID=3417650 RepID=UPI003CF8703B
MEEPFAALPRTELGVPTGDFEDQDAVTALYDRFHRAWSRLARILDPVRMSGAGVRPGPRADPPRERRRPGGQMD